MENTDQSSVSAKPAAGGAAPAGGGGGKEKIEKQARQLAYDTRYKVRQTMSQQSGGKADPAAVRKAYMAQLGKSPAPPAVKARAKQMLLGENIVNVEELLSKNVSSVIDKVFVEGVKEEEVIEEDSKGEKTYKVRVTDKKTGNTYVRNATRDKIRELRANPNISSVEMTEYGEPTKSEKHKGGDTAAVKSGKGDEISGKDTSIDLKKEEYSSLKSENFDGFLELVEKSKEEKKGKITGEGVNNNKLVKVFPDDVKEEKLDEKVGGAGTLVRQGVKVGGKKGGRAVQKGQAQAIAAGQGAKETVKGGNPNKMVGSGKFEKTGAVIGGVGGALAGGVLDGPLPVGDIVGGIAGGKLGGKIGRQFDKIGAKKPVEEGADYTDGRPSILKGKTSADSPKVAKLRDKLSKRGITDKKEQDKHPQISEEGTSVTGNSPGPFYKFDVGNPSEIKKNMQNANKGKFQKIGAKDSKSGLDVTMNDKGETGLSYSEQMDPVVEATLQNLEELKKRTLGSYVKKATGEVYRGAMDFGHKPLDPGAGKLAKKVQKRTAGIRDATDRLDGSRDIIKGRKTTTKEETQVDPVVEATVKNLDEIVGATLGTVAGAKFLPGVLAKAGLKGALAGKVAGGALGAAAGEVIDPLKKGKDKNPVSAAVGGAAGTAAHGAIKGALQKSSYEPEINNNIEVVVEAPAKVPLKDTGNWLQNRWNEFVPPIESSNNPNVRSGVRQPGSLEKPGLDAMNTTAANINKPIKATSQAVNTVKDIAQDPGKFVAKHGKSIAKAAAPVAGGLAVGLAAKKVTDKVMGHGVKEDTDYGDDQKEVAPGTVCFDDGAALPATIKPIGDPREMSTALNLIKNKWRAKGLKMSYEPKGDHLGEDATKNGKVKLKPKYKVEEGKKTAAVTGALGNIVGGTVGGAIGGPAGATVGSVAGGALGGAAGGRKGKKKRAAVGGALGSALGPIGSGVGSAIGASYEPSGDYVCESTLVRNLLNGQ